MDAVTHFQEQVFSTQHDNFDERALALFRWQAEHNPVYRQYLAYRKVDTEQVQAVRQIPFLPIQFFKYHTVLSTHQPIETTFESSGTTGQQRSQHAITNLSFYHRVCQAIFEARFGLLSSYHILALLPSYLERKNASLVAMVDYFIQQSQSPYSGFYQSDYEGLIRTLQSAKADQRKVLLMGVTFALLELAERYAPDLQEVTILETGGMKGRRKEMIRPEVHQVLREQTHVQQIHSEYGMTELLSQAYTQSETSFRPPPWMRVFTREITDPFTLTDRQGGINVIDLANVHSCAFLETQDIGKVLPNRIDFEVLGRFDNSDVRGCNLMMSL